MDVTLTDLSWLAVPPEDFRRRIRNLGDSPAQARTTLRHLAGYRLTSNQLNLLGTAINKIALDEPDAIRLGVLSNGTTDLLLPAFAASTLRHGLWAQVMGTAFDQVAAEALNARSALNQARCQFVLVAVDHRGLPLVPQPGDLSRARATVEAALEYLDSIRQALRTASQCTVIVQTLPQVSSSLFGSLERCVPGTLQWLIEQFNAKLRARIEDSSDLLLDAGALAETVGLARWNDPTPWTVGRFPFSLGLVPLYAEWVGRLIAVARGKMRKCLVLDLDNTLWGGVIGDDGLAGIVLGNGDPTGEAFLAIQQTALSLRERGIVLAVSSKNEDSVAREPFRFHPEMLLREHHIAVFQANWQDKASNLKAIANTLNIGVDSLVLLDDNPAERAQIRQALPTVAVPELPIDPALYPGTLLAAGYFEASRFTAEDQVRAEQYQVNAARAQTLGAATDLKSYLCSLEMKAICKPFDRLGRARITQLINKSNQFNLTTRRYLETEVESLEAAACGLTLQVRLIDRFGDNGIVSVVICREEGSDWIIDTWLMSCRVLNRQLEWAMLNYVVERAQDTGVGNLIGQYLKTERNGIVQDHYARLGFEPIIRSEPGSWYLLDVNAKVKVTHP